MKTILLRLFATNYGTLLRWLASAILALALAGAAKLGLELDDTQTAMLGAFCMTIASGLIGELLMAWQGKSIAEIQAAIQPLDSRILIDKWAGPQTLKTIERAAKAIGSLEQSTVTADLPPPQPKPPNPT